MSLQERLDRIREGSAAEIPADMLATMHRATEDLRASGILDGVLAVGDSMPAFRLPNAAGTKVSSGDLLAKGPLVVGFFRGRW